MISGLGHIAVRAGDIEESLRFYTEVLGLKEAFRMHTPDGVLATVYLYIAPHQFLELFSRGTRRGVTGSDVIGLCHICLETRDIHEAYAQVCQYGGPIDREISVGQSKCLMFWTHDPDGNPIEIMELVRGSMQLEASERLSGKEA